MVNTFSTFPLARARRQATKRNIVLQIKTYDRLEGFKIELVTRKKNPNITFDEAINELLDEHSSKQGVRTKE